MKLLLNQSILLVCILTSIPATGQEAYRSKDSAPLRFKLNITVEEKPLFADKREIKPLPTVDSALISQMLNVRQDLPSWQGVHHLVPGAGSVSGH